MSKARRVLPIVLLVLVVPLAIRVGLGLARFASESVQQDFASYYVAGQAVARGLSPFDNHVTARPPLWDGVAVHRHSRFLYPPIVAWVFVPLGGLSYPVAKLVWMLFVLGALGLALWQAARAVSLKLDTTYVLALAAIATAYFPLLTLLERGQTDSMTLALAMVAVCLMVERRRPVVAGVLLALASIVKLHGIFLLPFLIVRRRGRAVIGFVAGGLGVVVLSLAVHGQAPLERYVTDELPRISRWGDAGPGDSRLSPSVLRSLVAGASPGRTVVQGRVYDIESLVFEINASVVRTPLGRATWNGVRALGLPIAPAHVSLVFFAVGLGLVFTWQRRYGAPRDRIAEFCYWNVVLILILLCAPLSWSMGTVWLLPTAAVVLKGMQDARRPGEILPLVLCVAGLLVASLPDPWVTGLSTLARWKYVVAELLCLGGLLGMWRARRAGGEREA